MIERITIRTDETLESVREALKGHGVTVTRLDDDAILALVPDTRDGIEEITDALDDAGLQAYVEETSDDDVGGAAMDAVEEAMGYEVDADVVMAAIEKHAGTATDKLQAKLQVKERMLESRGGRGVELADEIDALRIAVTVRTATED